MNKPFFFQMAVMNTGLLVPIQLEKCIHGPGLKTVKSYNPGTTVHAIFCDVHSGSHGSTSSDGDVKKSATIACRAMLSSGDEYEVQHSLTLKELKELGAKELKFKCMAEQNLMLVTVLKKTNDAFSRMMAGRRMYPAFKTKRFVTYVEFYII